MTAVLTAAAPARPAHRDPQVLRWLGAFTASTLGDSVYHLALSWAAVRGGTPAEAGLVMAVSAVPRALLMLGGGVIADRLGPRRVVLASDTVRCVVVLGVAALVLVTSPTLWVLAGVALVFGVVDALFMPAVGALPPRIAPHDQLARVQGLRGLAYRSGAVLGAPLGGLAVALGGPGAAFAVAGALFALSLPLLLALRLRPLTGEAAKENGTAYGDLVDGLRYLRGHRVLGPLMIVIALSDLGFVGPLNVGLALLSDQRGWGASGIGWVLAGFGVGAGSASLLLGVKGRVPRAGAVLGWTMTLGAVSIGALAFVPRLPVAVAVALAIGLLAGLSGALCGALVQTECDPAYLGRVSAVSSLVSLGLAPLTYPLTGAAIGLWGVGPVFTVSAAICALAGVYGLAVRTVRRAELPR
ncbi:MULTISPECIES: MFS transporter [Streptomyces]|uniref:Putative integral membrane efflux protein n=2 Tax=Streptomyces venezuelae TaxID=54571 RepID=F2RI03_STRVP|nr:MFS transporter [Streptomyces venezuelae]APE21025.1 MFS transporter [Streptomyces venezuelae]QER98416.1 MFS transporter [Streptomyces venezuelae ATCC 10712]CCA54986.1 putative integral membrane efflux protein [Streptomyces venezuelae ATCC 10712]